MTGVAADLAALHDFYVAQVNRAVAADDLALVEELVESFEEEALALIVDQEPATVSPPDSAAWRPWDLGWSEGDRSAEREYLSVPEAAPGRAAAWWRRRRRRQG